MAIFDFYLFFFTFKRKAWDVKKESLIAEFSPLSSTGSELLVRKGTTCVLIADNQFPSPGFVLPSVAF